MKGKSILSLLGLVALCCTASAQTNAFTYQGRLAVAGSPATGLYDFRFSLCPDAAGGAAAELLTNTAVGVTNGLFVVPLNFGAEFDGPAYCLDIAVRTNGSAEDFHPLSPRQALTPTPYALYSASAGTAANARAVAATNVSGTLFLAQLPVSVVTNGACGLSLSGTFAGDAAGLTNVPAAHLTGRLALAQLPVAVATANDETGNGTAADAQIYGREYLGAWFSNLVANANVRVDFVGDSTTSGGGLALAGFAIDQLFARTVGYPNLTVYNSGMSGISTALWATNYGGSLANTISRNPTLIFVRYGINDYPDLNSFSNALNTGLATLRAALPVSQTSIVLETPNSINDQGTPARNMSWNVQLDPVIRAAARRFSCAFVDVFTCLRDTTNSAMVWKNDQVHPIEYGYLMINELHLRAVYPPSIAAIVERRNNHSRYTAPDISAVPTNYPFGYSIARISPTTGWALNGMVVTERSAEDIGFQRASEYTGNKFQFRTGWRGAWNQWQTMMPADINFNVASSVFAPDVTNLPNTYASGFNLHRASPSTGYPYNGPLFTLYEADGTYYQQNTAYNALGFAFRGGANNTWQPWQYVVTGSAPGLVEAANVVASALSASVAITNHGMIWFALATNQTPAISAPPGSICTTTNGQLYVRSNNVWLLK